MSVDQSEVERIAKLAHLRFTSEEIERLTAELNGILRHVAALQDVDREPEAGDGESAALASTRADESAEPDALLKGPSTFAPDWTDGFFVVPPPPGVHHDGNAS